MVPEFPKHSQRYHSQLLRSEMYALLSVLLLYHRVRKIHVTFTAPESDAVHLSTHPKFWNCRVFLVFLLYILQL